MNPSRKLDFLGKRKLAYIFSGTLFLISIMSFMVKGMNLGIDFTGGSVYELHYNQSVDLDKMRSTLEQQGFGDANIQHFGSSQDVLIRLKPIQDVSQKDLTDKILSVSNTSQPQAGELRRVEFVGPQIGDELLNDGGLALFLSLIGVMVYVSVRFEWKLSVGAIAALFHDTIITMGFFLGIRLGVRHDGIVGHPGACGLFHQRYHRGLRPHPRNRSHQPGQGIHP